MSNEDLEFGTQTDIKEKEEGTFNLALSPNSASFLKEIEVVEEEIAKTKVESEQILLDLDAIDPLKAYEAIQVHMSKLKDKSTISRYLQETSFQDVDISDIPVSEEVKSQIDDIIFELEENKELSKDDGFIQKLYKLKSLRHLVDMAIQTKFVSKQNLIIKKRCLDLIQEYQSAVTIYIQNQLVHKEEVEDKELSEEEIKTIEGLKTSLAEALGKSATLQEQLDTAQKTYEAKVIELTSEIDSIKNTENAIEPSSESEEEEEDETLLQIMEKNGHLENIIMKLKKDISLWENMVEEKDAEIARLKEELSFTQSQNIPASDNSYESDKTSEYTEETPPKKKSIFKIFLITLGAIITLMIAGVSIAYITMDESLKSPQPAQYMSKEEVSKSTEPTTVEEPKAVEVPKPVTEQKEEPAIQIDDPYAKSLNEPTPPQSSTPIVEEKEPEYDFVKELTLEEFEKNQFELLGTTQIKINNKEFTKGDIINGFRFEKATSGGKILFITADFKPIWIGK